MSGLGSIFETLISLPLWLLEWQLSKEERIKRKVARTPLKSIANAKMNSVVKLRGEARKYDRLSTAPLSGKECIGYQTTVTRDDWNGGPREFADESIFHRFYLSEGDKQILIIPTKAEVNLKLIVSEKAGILGDASEELKKFLSKYHRKTKSFWVNKALEAKEKVLTEGQLVEVVGKITVFHTKNGESHIVMRVLENTPLYIKA